MDMPDTATELPSDPMELVALLRTVDPAEAPDLVERIAEALERALADADEG